MVLKMGGETVAVFLLRSNILAKDGGFEAVNTNEHRNQSVFGAFILLNCLMENVAAYGQKGLIAGWLNI